MSALSSTQAPAPPPSVHSLLLAGDVDRAKRMLNDDIKLAQQKDDTSRLPIHWACSLGFFELVEFLLNNSKVDVDVRDSSDLTPLIIAASAGRAQIVRLLIGKGVDVNAKNSGGHSALQYAASKNHAEIVEILLTNNADPNITDNMNATPLHRAASQGNTKIVQILLAKGEGIDVNAKDSAGNTPLHLACEENRIEEAKILVAKGARANIQNKAEKTPLQLASPSTASILNNIVAMG